MTRIEHDYYPTPPDVVEALRVALYASFEGCIALTAGDAWLDPAAGAGTLLEWLGIDHELRHAIELRPEAEAEIEGRTPRGHVRIGDAMAMAWPEGNIAANPPFSAMEGFVRRIVGAGSHHFLSAVLMPTQWLQAQRRADIPPPAYFWPLKWRPSFRLSGGAMHDVAWAVWVAGHTGPTTCAWLPRPTATADKRAEYRRLLDGQK